MLLLVVVRMQTADESIRLDDDVKPAQLALVKGSGARPCDVVTKKKKRIKREKKKKKVYILESE